MDPADAAAVYPSLLDHQAELELQTLPLPAFAVDLQDKPVEAQEPPKLLRAYLALGAKIVAKTVAAKIAVDSLNVAFMEILLLHRVSRRVHMGIGAILREKLAGGERKS